MITRIEIDGFKSFVDFELDVPPFAVLLGPNAGGKSNLLDALRALVEIGRGGGGSFGTLYEAGRGTAREMFHQREDESRVSVASFRCEMLADAHEVGGLVALAFQARATYEAPFGDDRVRVKAEVSGDPHTIIFPRGRDVPAGLYENVSRTGRRISTGPEYQDIAGLPPGALYGIPFAEMLDGRQRAMWFLARELRTWQFLSLVPSAMRDRGLVTDAGPLRTDGSNLAAVLGRISRTDAMWDLITDAVALVPGLRNVEVTRDRDYWELQLTFRGTGRVSARMASDGTLRILAILAALHDPENSGVLIVDEVENGLHPARLTELLARTRARVTDWRAPLAGDVRLRQVIFTTHSPAVLSSIYPEHRDDLIFLSTYSHPWDVDGRAVGSLVTRASAVGAGEGRGAAMALGEARRILETVHPVEAAACDT